MNESLAILRFLGKEVNMYPKDAFESYKVDMIIDYLNDFIPKLCGPHLMKKDFSHQSIGSEAVISV